MSFLNPKVLFTVTIYLKSGQTIVLTDLEVFKVTRNGSGELSKLEWAFDAKTNTQILNLPVENVTAIISVKQP